MTDFFGPGTGGHVQAATPSVGSTVGVAAGFLDTDASSLTFLTGNNFSGAATTRRDGYRQRDGERH